MKFLMGYPDNHDGLGVLGRNFNHQNHDTLNIPDTPACSQGEKDTFK